MATLQSGKCFTVPTFFGMCCRSEWQERMYIYKWHEVDQTKHEIFCVHIVCNEIQVKVNLEITTFFFYLRFPYCPNFSDLGLCVYISIYIYIYIYILYVITQCVWYIQCIPINKICQIKWISSLEKLSIGAHLQIAAEKWDHNALQNSKKNNNKKNRLLWLINPSLQCCTGDYGGDCVFT